MEYDNKIKVKVEVKSGFSLFFSISLFSETSSEKAERTKAVNLRKKTAKNTKSYPRYLSGKVLRSCYNPTHCQLKESGREKKRFHARG